MLESIISGLVKELRAHPYTLVVVAGLVGFALFSWSNFARSEPFQLLAKRVTTIEETQIDIRADIRRSALEQEIANVDREIFNIERIIDSLKSSGSAVEPIYEDRLSELKIYEMQAVRELSRIDAAHPKVKL